ncbi:uncharacterized protein LOC142519787 [Primulina tabacum]|uniref:uncharacterized protein LOC142519787 n=1 Tax=Primulina tabacum TaxID=48773 RepID=UPI003F59B84D
MTAAGPITWQHFREAFLKQYYPAEVRLQKLSEFENFTQAPDMSVVKYTSQFNALGSYALEIMVDEVLKLYRFKKGLNSRIPSALAIYQLANFSDLMGVDIRAKADIRRREWENRNKHPLISQPSLGGQKFKRPDQAKLALFYARFGMKVIPGLLQFSIHDYDLTISYHPGKANKVADALSRKGTGKVTLASLSAQPCLQETVKLNQDRDPVLTKLKDQVGEGKSQDLQIDDKGILWMKRRPCVPDSDNLRQEIMAEAHKSKFSVHPGSTKMHRTSRIISGRMA